MEKSAYREPFDSIGITPPRGRQGHSVPTPRPLSGGGIQDQPAKQTHHPAPIANIVHQAPVAMTTGKLGPSPVQFYSRREHSTGGSLSKLNRLASRTELSYLESFSEVNEEPLTAEDTEATDGEEMDFVRPASRQSRTSTDLGASRSSGWRPTLEQFTGDSLLHFSYSAHGGPGLGLASDSLMGGSFVNAFAQGLNSSLTLPFLGGRQSPSSPDINTSTLFPTAARNPNKAIITIDAQSSRILTANEMTCELFGYQRNELINMKVQGLFTEPYRAEHRALIEQNIDSSGKTVLISGKVMDAVTSYGVEFPVSVWMKRVGVPPSPDIPGPLVSRVILIVEPVERSSALFSLDHNGAVLSFDPWFSCLFGYTEQSEMVGKNVSQLLPSLKLPSSLEEFANVPKKQAITGRCIDGTVFPVTVKFTDVSQNLSIGDLYSPTNIATSNPLDEIVENMCSTSPTVESPPSANCDTTDGETPTHKGENPGRAPERTFVINAKVVVYAALSGMISFLPDGSIHGCNNHFTSMLFGYSQAELLKKDITFLIPDFYGHINYIDESGMPLPSLDEDQEDLFHSAVERSLSPEKAYELVQQSGSIKDPVVARREDTVSPKHKKSDHHRSPARRALNLNQVLAHSPQDSSSSFEAPKVVLLTSAPSDNDCATTFSEECVTLSSTEVIKAPREDLRHVPSPDSLKHQQANPSEVIPASNRIQTPPTLPPVPNRLVPSKSTERIYEILKQHDLNKGKKTAIDEVCSLEPLSSTPAGKAYKVSTSSSMDINFTIGQRRESYGSMFSVSSLPEGTFLGEARHKDSSRLAIIFQLKSISLANDQRVFCLWISRDLDRDRARTADLSMSMSRPPPDPYRSDQMISPDVVTGGEDKLTGPLPLTQVVPPTEEVVAMDGEYSLSYHTLQAIGKGAFGFVRLAQRKEDNHVVVVKFLRKSSVLKDCWMEDPEMGRVPLEISLLARLSHPNIVQLLEAYENEFFFQMVMEKHGDGLDLFEFIEMGPQLEEPLISYMFRQIVSGLSYLHDQNILHRDVKDENIIIDQEFHLKLIDFGSAAYMAPGKVFNTFCGTLEYCSPEVLLGNSYAGPELEMWALGVTLYTLVFGENPFFDIEETISGHLQPPYLTSPGLMKVFFWLLHPDPKSRATLKDLQKDKWTNQAVDLSVYSFNAVLGVRGSRNGVSEEPPVMVVKSNSENDAAQLHSVLEQQLKMGDR